MQSLPSRERGLKLHHFQLANRRVPVAPLAGAWIEISFLLERSNMEKVAPLAGAWIEIFLLFDLRYSARVAPLAGAWIEILQTR